MKDSKQINDGLWVMLNRTRHLMYKARQKELKHYGISVRNAGVLSTIARLGADISPKTIAQELFLEHHSVSEMLSRMEKKGLIKRVKDQERKNLIRLEVTEKGYEAYRMSTVRESTNIIMSALTQKEKLELWSILSKLRKSTTEHLGVESIDPYPPSDPAKL